MRWHSRTAFPRKARVFRRIRDKRRTSGVHIRDRTRTRHQKEQSHSLQLTRAIDERIVELRKGIKLTRRRGNEASAPDTGYRHDPNEQASEQLRHRACFTRDGRVDGSHSQGSVILPRPIGLLEGSSVQMTRALDLSSEQMTLVPPRERAGEIWRLETGDQAWSSSGLSNVLFDGHGRTWRSTQDVMCCEYSHVEAPQTPEDWFRAVCIALRGKLCEAPFTIVHGPRLGKRSPKSPGQLLR